MGQTHLLKLTNTPILRIQMRYVGLLLVIALLCPSFPGAAQVERASFLRPADSLDKTRVWLASATTAGLYTGTVIGLNEIWYKQYPRSSFHFYNDWGEWENMDKMGHLLTGYFESRWVHRIARWTGIPDRSAEWVGVGMGMLFQSTVEVMDGFSEQWGFSVPDFAFNALGASAFLVQQRIWGDQRISLKVSGATKSYPSLPVISQTGEYETTLRTRTNELFGTGFFERLLKDYNAQTIWASVNIASFLADEESRFPKWLNVALGYGARNMYGGFSNTWEEDGVLYHLDDRAFPRYAQFYVSPDIDFTRIPSNRPFVRTLLEILNVVKIPAPALQLSCKGTTLHLLHF